MTPDANEVGEFASDGAWPLSDLDVDSLANERTLLAWTRTGFTLVATGALVLHTTEYRFVVRELAIGTATIFLGVVVWGFGFLRFKAGERKNADPYLRLIPVAIIRAVAVAVSLVALGALLIAVLPPR